MNKCTKLNNLVKQFFKKYPYYCSLGENFKQIIRDILKEHQLSFLMVESRIKNVEQFIEKIYRKGYENPFEEMEDICGLRIICYFQRDISKIEEVLKNNFEIVHAIAKPEAEDPLKFGYRSRHLVVKIKENWQDIPHFKTLVGLKAEIQIRTVLMHAWAEIEHKLAYKKYEHIPKPFRRKFARLSAKLEEADEQFEELMEEIEAYKKDTLQKVKEDKIFNKETLLDLDTLQSFLDFYLPHHPKDIHETRNFLDQVLENKMNIEKLVNLFESFKLKKRLEKSTDTQTEATQKIFNATQNVQVKKSIHAGSEDIKQNPIKYS